MQVYLVKLLEDKLKYLRNYKGKHSTGSRSSDAMVNVKKTPKNPQGPRPPVIYIEDDSYDEDEAGFERHLKFLQREYKKLRPDDVIVKEMMKKTFKIRRQHIQEVPTRVTDILETYPALQNYDHVSI